MSTTLMTEERRQRAVRLIAYHRVEHSLPNILQDDTMLIEVLATLTPWAGDSYDDIAYVHGHALSRTSALLHDERTLGRLHGGLISSIADWLSLVSPKDRSSLASALLDWNGDLLESYRIGSRAIVGLLLLLNPDRDGLAQGVSNWPGGRFALDDICRTCDQAMTLGVNPVHALCWDISVIKDFDEERRPIWYDLDISVPSFAEPMGLSREEIDSHLGNKERTNLTLSILGICGSRRVL